MASDRDSKDMGSTQSNHVTRICSDTKITGTIITQHDIRIDGYLEGKIKTEGKLVIGESGKCKGEVHCKSVDISGSFDGVLKSTELASLREKCIFTGEIHSDQISIEPTVRISGTLVSPELSKKDEKKPLPSTTPYAPVSIKAPEEKGKGKGEG
ncbi:MAG: polymer-forming cytoskeletal protein [Bacteroidales bacterium]|nr:polymer-forming cytoskeletal protein [Bacteroidales bacterium]